MIKHVKAKGSSFEREIAKDLRDAGLDKTAKRMVLSGAIDGFKSDIQTKLPICIEAKRQEKWKVMKFYKQAVASARNNELPIVVMKKNRQDPMALLSWKDLIYLFQLALEGGWSAQLGFSKKKQLNK